MQKRSIKCLYAIALTAFLALGAPQFLSADDIPGYGDISLTDSLSTTATTFDLNFHLTPGSESFDVSLGAGLAYLSYGNLSFDDQN